MLLVEDSFFCVGLFFLEVMFGLWQSGLSRLTFFRWKVEKWVLWGLGKRCTLVVFRNLAMAIYGKVVLFSYQ